MALMTPSRRGMLAGAGALAAMPVLGAHTAEAEAAPFAFRALAARRKLMWGCAVEPEIVDGDPAFAALVRRQCSVLTPENALKWNALRPSPSLFDFTGADRVVALAREQQARVHGHCLVWHEAMPDWLTQNLTPATGAALLSKHIHAVVSRYAGRIHSWDVVNEAVERNDRRPDGLRASPWMEAMGPGYIDTAFHLAHQADPAARLAFADYGLEYDNVSWMVEKRGTMLQVLRGLLKRGVPVHALALQGHLDASRPIGFGDGLYRFLREVADLGLEIYITELDVNDQMLPGDVAHRDAVVAANYHAFLDVVLAEPAVRMVNTWGLSDKHTSRATMFPRPDGASVRPLPFDRDMQPKPAAFAIAEVLRK